MLFGKRICLFLFVTATLLTPAAFNQPIKINTPTVWADGGAPPPPPIPFKGTNTQVFVS